jgi:hypothetical protein
MIENKHISQLNNRKNDLIDFEKQAHRELEGDDTITPLTNATFLKQLTKLKQLTNNAVGSSKSINTLKSFSENSFNVEIVTTKSDDDQMSVKKFLSKRMPERLQKLFVSKSTKTPKQVDDLQFFRSKSKLNANKIGKRVFDSTDSDNLKASRLTSSIDDFDRQTSNENEVAFDKNSLLKTMSGSYALSTTTKISASATIAAVPANKTDQMYDAISSIMSKNVLIENDFIESVKLIVRQSELIKKKRVDMSIFVCRVFLFSFLVFMVAFFFLFLYTLDSISNEFQARIIVENVKLGNNTISK